MDPFRFTITLPADADWLSLIGELSNHVARLVGLGESAAREAKEELQDAVRERMRTLAGRGSVEVMFERKAGEETVTVHVAEVSRRFLWNARSSG